jgi:hypothetical protein
MAPPDRQPEPGHPAVQGLHPSLAGHRGEIAVWVDWLLHPELHEYDRTILYPDGRKKEVGGNRQMPNAVPHNENYPFESVLAGRYIEQFFDPAFALSGQLVDKDEAENAAAGRIFSALDNARWRNTHYSGRLAGGFEDIRERCSGSAVCVGGGTFIGGVDDFTTHFVVIAEELAEIMTAYCATIVMARESLHKVMGLLVDAFHHKFYARGIPADEVTLFLFGATVGIVTTAISGGGGAAVFASALSALLNEAAKQHVARIGGETWDNIVSSYFRSQIDVLDDARVEIGKLEEMVVALQNKVTTLPPVPQIGPPGGHATGDGEADPVYRHSSRRDTEGMREGAGAGYAVDPATIDDYVERVVDPALTTYEKIADELRATCGDPQAQLTGHANLPGSTRFTEACDSMLRAFFDVHTRLHERQVDLVQNVTAFRDALTTAAAMYLQTDRDSARQLQGLLHGYPEAR